MAQLQVPIDNNLKTQAKIYAMQHNTTLKEVVEKALEYYLHDAQTKSGKE